MVVSFATLIYCALITDTFKQNIKYFQSSNYAYTINKINLSAFFYIISNHSNIDNSVIS